MEGRPVSIKLIFVLRLTSCFIQAQRSCRGSCVPVRAVLQAPRFPSIPPEKKKRRRRRSLLISAVSNPQIPLHFLEFHFPQPLIFISHQLLHWEQPRKQNRRVAPEKVVWWAPSSGEEKYPGQSQHSTTATVTFCPSQRPRLLLPPKLLPRGVGKPGEGKKGRRKCVCVCACVCVCVCVCVCP